MKQKISADECDAALALTFFLTTPVIQYFFASSVLFLIFFVIKLFKRGIQIDANLTCLGVLRC